MDARSIAATAANRGRLTSAEELDVAYSHPLYHFEKSIYEKKIYWGVGKPRPEVKLTEGPNIKPWPEMQEMPEHMLVKLCSFIDDAVTTTDELIPSGDISSYRSNPIKLSEFTLCRQLYLAISMSISHNIRLVFLSWPVGWIFSALFAFVYYWVAIKRKHIQ